MKPNTRTLAESTAQVYQDCLYAYGIHGSRHDEDAKNELWSFDLKNHAWKLCETSGEGLGPTQDLRSFIFQDSLVVYTQWQKDLFLLNFNTMKWTKIEQQEEYLENTDVNRIGGVLYKDHLVIPKIPLNFYSNTLCFLNLQTKNTWKTFAMKRPALFPTPMTSLMVYNDLLLCFGREKAGEDFTLFVLNLESKELNLANIYLPLDLGICTLKSAEEEEISSLFMSQTDSDIALKIEDKVVPAHKSVLIKKSRYFEGLFKSGMAESRQDIIEINDCEYEIFQEYLRFVYQDTVDFSGDINRTTKLYTLADKFLQLDLQEKCLNYFTYKINIKNFDAILDFAHQKDIPHIKIWCLKFFEDNLNINNVGKLVHYLLDRQEDSDFKEDHKELRVKASTFASNNFFMIHDKEKENMKAYEKLLIENIKIDTIPAFAKFLADFDKLPEDKKSCFKKFTSQFKEAVLCFVQEKVDVIMTSKIAKDLPNGFLVDFTLYQARKLEKLQRVINERKDDHPEMCIEKHGNDGKKLEREGKKRMESTKDDDVHEENPELKENQKM